MRQKNSSDGEVVSTVGPEISGSLARIQRVLVPMGNRDIDIQYAAEVAEVMVEKDYGPLGLNKLVEADYMNVQKWRLHKMGLSELQREAQELRETPLAEVGYRYAPEVKKRPEIPDDLSIPFLKENYAGKQLSDHIESLVAEETQTWLDVAFIRVATRAKLRQDGAIEEGLDVAKTFFGERSRVGKILELYGEQNAYEEGEVVSLAVISACVIMFVCVGEIFGDEGAGGGGEICGIGLCGS